MFKKFQHGLSTPARGNCYLYVNILLGNRKMYKKSPHILQVVCSTVEGPYFVEFDCFSRRCSNTAIINICKVMFCSVICINYIANHYTAQGKQGRRKMLCTPCLSDNKRQ